MNRAPIDNRIQAPPLPIPILHRETLVRMLADSLEQSNASQVALHKLILLCAPAGYGKTTLLADTVQRFSISTPCCWYFLESFDTPVVFLRILLASIRNRFPSFGRDLDALFPEPELEDNLQETWEVILDALVAALNSEILQPFILAFCDYHKVNQNEMICQLMNRLLACPLQQGVLVIESRSLPNLDLALLIAHRRMFGLGSNKLRFTAQELHALAHLQGFTAFSLQEAEVLINSFEGWIAGIMLGSCLGYTQMHPLAPSHKGNWGIQALLADRQQLFTYIVNEIFGQETATYEFLEAVSILDQLTPEHCNALLEIANAAELLIYAEQQGLFVMRSDASAAKDNVGVYICHPILRELFRENLRRQSFARYLALHRRVAYLSQNEQALMHALLAQEYSLAIDIMMRIAPGLITQGYGETVTRWLDMLPEQMVQQDPRLLLTQATIHLTRNEYAQVSSLLDTVEVLLETASSEQNLSTYALLQIELSLARSKLLFYQGEFQSAQELCRQVLNILPADEHHLRIQAHQRLGTCFVVGSGLIHEGITQFQQALQLSGSQKEEQQTATLYRLLANAYGWIGNYVLANYHQVRALQIWEKLNEPWGIINSLTSMGLLKLRQGLTQEAEMVLSKALHQARDVYHFTSGEAYALAALGEFYCTLAQYVQALKYLEDGLRLAYQCEDRYLMHCNFCSMATTYLFMGEVQVGQFFLNQVTLKEQEESSFQGLLYRLTQGRLFLAQQATYKQAQHDLERAVTLGKRTNIQFLSMQALLLVAICYAKQQKVNEAFQILEETIELNKKGDFDYIIKIESSRYPELQGLLGQATRDKQARQEEASVNPKRSYLEHQSSSAGSMPLTGDQCPDVAWRLQIQALGEPKVLIDTIPITRWHMTRSLELFFLLLERACPVQKDQMIDALWPHATSEQIDTTVRTAIYYLRQAIGKACIVYHSGFYSLDLSMVYEKQIWYDVDIFQENYRIARKALEDDQVEVATTAFTAMVELYKGDYVQSFYSDWCISRRGQLRQGYIDARQQLARIAWQRERWDESLLHWQHLLAVDACFERAHYGVMRYYLRKGKRELALRQYQRCCQNLREELQTTPGSSIQKLYQSIV